MKLPAHVSNAVKRLNPEVFGAISGSVFKSESLHGKNTPADAPTNRCMVCKAPLSKTQLSKKQKYCSLTCAYSCPVRRGKLGKNNRTKKRGLAVCVGCGKTFCVTTNGPKKYCSKRCFHDTYSREAMRNNRQCIPRTNWTEKKCVGCGKPFSSWKSNNRKYCSLGCSLNYASARAMNSAMKMHSSGYYKSSKPHSRSVKGWRTINGKRCFFRSRMEANFARYLTFLGKRWEYECKTFWFDGIKRGVRSYTPDFYLPDEDRFVETKGWMDSKSATKIKRMSKYHPSVNLEVMDYKRWRVIEKQVRKIVPEWES